VVVGLRGGLGNQLFQFASGYGIARRVGAELFFDGGMLGETERWLPELLGSYYREATRLRRLRLGAVHDSDLLRNQVAHFVLSHVVDAGRRVRRRTAATMPRSSPSEDAGRYDEALLSIDLPTYLYGWFQTERYFCDVADEIVDLLRLPQVPLPRPSRDAPVVSLSFRRGDYVRYGWQLPFSYYERALDLMVEAVPGATFLVFGDDPEFVRLATDWASRFGPATNAYDLSDGALEHLVLASECDHALMANSSFAWWAAWLGDKRAGDTPRVVIAPEDYRRQFGPDVLASNWVAVTSA
jgi:hypothetical protein